MTEIMCDWIKGILTETDKQILYVIYLCRVDFLNDVSTAEGWTKFIKEGIKVTEGVALIIVSICFLLEFLKMTMKFEVLKWEFLFKVFFKLVLAKVCIDIAFDLLMAIYQTAIDWVADMNGDKPMVGHTVWNSIKDTVEGYGILDMIGLVCSAGIIYLGISLCTLIVRIMALCRMVEIVIYMALAPLPCAFLPLEDGGTSRIPKNYFINFASLCLSGVVMMLSLYLYGVVTNTFIIHTMGEDPFTAVGGLFVATIILVLTMSKSGNIAKSILSAG